MPKTMACNNTGSQIAYEIRVGFSLADVIKLQAEWAADNTAILQTTIATFGTQLNDNSFAQSKLIEYNLSDFNWDWGAKAYHCSSNDYIWFLLIADGKAQGACIAFHPKQSKLDGCNIFYIDYIAASYENRDRPGHQRRFSGIGSRLLSYVTDYANKQFNYRHGFCLHSLPTAEVYYRGLGLTEYPADPAKENLVYFEACPTTAARIAGVA